MSSACWPDLKWPTCNPQKNVLECSPTLDKNVACCLSAQTKDSSTSNCPPGWTSDASNADEWCTDDWNAFSPNVYRHKCQRIGTLQDAARVWTNTESWPEQAACSTAVAPHLLEHQPSLALGSAPADAAPAYAVFIGVVRALRTKQLVSYLPYVSTAGGGTLFWGTYSFAFQYANPLGVSVNMQDMLNFNTPGAPLNTPNPSCYRGVCTATPLEYLNELNFDNFFYVNPDEYQNDTYEMKEFNNAFMGNGVVTSPGGHTLQEYLQETKSYAKALGRKFLWRYGLDKPRMLISGSAAQAEDARSSNQNAYPQSVPFKNGPFWVANASTSSTHVDVTPMYACLEKGLRVETFALGAPPANAGGAIDACSEKFKFIPSTAFEPFGLSHVLATSVQAQDTSIWTDSGDARPVHLQPGIDHTGMCRLFARNVTKIISVIYVTEATDFSQLELHMPGVSAKIAQSMEEKKAVVSWQDVLLLLVYADSTHAVDFMRGMPADVQAYAPVFPPPTPPETPELERPMVNLLAAFGEYLVNAAYDQVSAMFTRVCPQPPQGGCYSNLSWPSCDPNGESVLACADVAPRDVYNNLISDDVNQPCCLTGETVQDFHDTICPTGWTTTPDEYCTSKAVDILYGPHYRYKCHRTCTT